ncbi:transposase [Streptomyces europaeiscabiei]|uniref:transposase n=2 Tax=Streptomyces europaeiscabiei TaxID=146819 RepID=UPI00386AAE33
MTYSGCWSHYVQRMGSNSFVVWAGRRSRNRPRPRPISARSGTSTPRRAPRFATANRGRTLTTQAGDLDLAIPKLRSRSPFPALLERRRRIDQAQYAVIMEAYVHGVSTRSVDPVKALGAYTGISRSEVSRRRISSLRTSTVLWTCFPGVRPR